MRNIVVFTGSSHPKLGESIAQRLGIPLGAVKLGQFSNKETSVQVFESVRDLDVYIIQSGCGNVNNALMEMLIMVNACKMASAAKVTVVLPLFPYARQADAPYKRNGLPRRVQPMNAIEGPVAKHLINQEEERKEKKLSQLNGPTASPSLSARGASPSTSSPLKSQVKSTTMSPLPLRILAAGNADSIPKLQVAATQTSGEHNVMISSPIQPNMSALGLAKTGYKHWVARSGKLVANMIVAAGADHIITMDLHDPQFQGFFEIPVDNLFGSPLMIKYIREKITDYKKAVIVSPDAGGAKRASNLAHKLGISFALIHKERKVAGYSSPSLKPKHLGLQSYQNTPKMSHSNSNQNSRDIGIQNALPHCNSEPAFSGCSPYDGGDADSNMILVGDVKGKTCILIDDIADTSRTITKAAQILHNHGATKIYALVTHGILSGDAPYLILDSKIDYLIVSNSVPQERNVSILGDRLRVFDVAGIFGEAIRRVHHGESVSYLYEPVAI